MTLQGKRLPCPERMTCAIPNLIITDGRGAEKGRDLP
jgi:hypothetical protein